MNMVSSFNAVPAPTHQPKDFLDYDEECRTALRPLLKGLLDTAVSAGWERRTVASTLMFLAAQHVSISRDKP